MIKSLGAVEHQLVKSISGEVWLGGNTAAPSASSSSPEHSNRSSPSLTRHTKALSSSPPVTASVLVLGSRLTQKTEASEKSKEGLHDSDTAHTPSNAPRGSKPHAALGLGRMSES